MKALLFLQLIMISVLLFTCFMPNCAESESGITSDDDQSQNILPIHPSIIPPGFENVLPADVLQQLDNLHQNNSLSFKEKHQLFDEIMDTVPGNILAQLPFPPNFNQLPNDTRLAIQAIHENTTLSWTNRNQQIKQLIDSLPSQYRPKFAPPFPGLPPGFEEVLPRAVLDKVISILTNYSIPQEKRIEAVDKIVRSQSQEIIDKLPLPLGFKKLPEEYYNKAHAIFSNRSLDYKEKNAEIIKFIKSLPEDLRQLVRPPLHPALEKLPQSIKNSLDDIFLDEDLPDSEKDRTFWRVIDGLPKKERTQIHQALGRPNSLEADDASDTSF